MWHDLKGGATSTRQKLTRQMFTNNIISSKVETRKISARQFLVLFKNISYLHLTQGPSAREHRFEQCQAFGNRASRTYLRPK